MSGAPRRRIQPGSAPSLQNDNNSPSEKDRQRYALSLTVFWLRPMCASKKTVRKTVTTLGYRSSMPVDTPIFLLIFQRRRPPHSHSIVPGGFEVTS
jgi:hypothetical protein